jgi:hypothetical protein
MAASENGSRSFAIHLSAAVSESTRVLLRHAIHAGNGKAVLTAYRKIVEGLTRKAASFGEPLYHLPSLELEVRHAVVGPLAVDYAVSLASHRVYIKGFRLL